jgi:hypothetical protein
LGCSLAVAAEACSAGYPSGSAAAVEVAASCPERYSAPAATAEDASFLASLAAAEAFGADRGPVPPRAVAEPSSSGCRDEGHRSGPAFHTAIAASVALASAESFGPVLIPSNSRVAATATEGFAEASVPGVAAPSFASRSDTEVEPAAGKKWQLRGKGLTEQG